MTSAEVKAKELISVANTIKKFAGIGSITLEGTLQDLKNEIDDFEKFLQIIDKAGYCLKSREDTHLGIFPADDNENIVFIEK